MQQIAMIVIVLLTVTLILVNVSPRTPLTQLSTTQFPIVAVVAILQRDLGILPCKFWLPLLSHLSSSPLCRYFSDSGCKNPVEAVSILNGYCLSPDQKMSYKYDYPKESYYFSNADCTGAVTTFDISSSANVCFPVSASSSLNSYETLFVKN